MVRTTSANGPAPIGVAFGQPWFAPKSGRFGPVTAGRFRPVDTRRLTTVDWMRQVGRTAFVGGWDGRTGCVLAIGSAGAVERIWTVPQAGPYLPDPVVIRRRWLVWEAGAGSRGCVRALNLSSLKPRLFSAETAGISGSAGSDTVVFASVIENRRLRHVHPRTHLASLDLRTGRRRLLLDLPGPRQLIRLDPGGRAALTIRYVAEVGAVTLMLDSLDGAASTALLKDVDDCIAGPTGGSSTGSLPALEPRARSNVRE